MIFTANPRRDLRQCESPIEQMFYEAAIKQPWYHFRGGGRLYGDGGIYPATQVKLGLRCKFSRFDWHRCEEHHSCDSSYCKWCCQEVHDYRLDFGIQLHRKYGLAIELDGVDFHNNQQADQRRQEDIERWYGFRFIRFTGSEVYRNVEQCVTRAREEFLHILLISA